MTALNQAYASNTETPLLTLEIQPISGANNIRLYRGYGGLLRTLEGQYKPAAIDIKLPERSNDGSTTMNFTVSSAHWTIMLSITSEIDEMRSGNTDPLKCTFRRYLPSVLAATPAWPYGTFSGAAYEMIIQSVSVNSSVATFNAKFAPLPDVSFPRLRYYSDRFPGLKYATR